MKRRSFECRIPLENDWVCATPMRFLIDYRVEGADVVIEDVLIEARPDDDRRSFMSKLYSMKAFGNPAVRALGEKVSRAALRDEAWVAAAKSEASRRAA